jgi:hypothetical protein
VIGEIANIEFGAHLLPVLILTPSKPSDETLGAMPFPTSFPPRETTATDSGSHGTTDGHTLIAGRTTLLLLSRRASVMMRDRSKTLPMGGRPNLLSRGVHRAPPPSTHESETLNEDGCTSAAYQKTELF